MHRTTIFVESPPFTLVTLAGAVATVLVTSLMYFAPAIGLPLVDIPTLLGGVWTSDPATALWSGYVLFFLAGWLVLPVVLMVAWNRLPGDQVGFGGAAVKGLLVGAATWLLSGILVGLLGLVSEVPALVEPGWFATGVGWAGAAALLVGHLVYGVALALVSAMGQGISPVSTIGWLGHGSGREA